MGRVFQLEELCREAYGLTPLPDAPVVASVEAFVVKCILVKQVYAGCRFR